MKKIIFVDDEPLILEATERMLWPMRHQWEMHFAHSGEQALQFMATTPADMVISDMRMPKMNGAELLNEVMQRHPRTARLILSGYADMEMIMQCIAGTHQFLAKPCNSQTLRETVSRTLEMDSWLNNDPVKTIVSGMRNLPSLPTLYFQILKELDSPDDSLEKISATIAQDQSMTAKILQLANSAFFGLNRKLTSSSEAVIQLGLETIKSLVLGIHVFSELESPAHSQWLRELWQHSFATAATAQRLCREERLDKQTSDDAFTGGLLHDIGRLVILANFPEQHLQALELARKQKTTLIAAEKIVLGVTHAEVGAYLLGLWGLPLSLVQTALFHHQPAASRDTKLTPLAVVHIANVLEQTSPAPFPLAELDRDYLTNLGLWEKTLAWRKSKTAP